MDFQGNAITISVAEAADGGVDLGATMITSNQLGTITEDSGSYTPGTIATATRLVLTPRETPVDHRGHPQNMDDFGLDDIDDVMRHTPGITVSAYDTDRNNYYARGFSINNFQYDGIPSTARNVGYSAGNTLSDMAIYDRVEVLKGATGLLTGAGSLGATINLIRKKPTMNSRAMSNWARAVGRLPLRTGRQRPADRVRQRPRPGGSRLPGQALVHGSLRAPKPASTTASSSSI